MEVEKMEPLRKLKVIDNAPGVFNVSNAVSYHPTSIVSKQLIKKETGSVTLFAFDEGQDLSEHTAPYDAMVHVLEGEAEIFITQKKYVVKAGEMIIMPANQPHALKALKKFKMLLVMIRS